MASLLTRGDQVVGPVVEWIDASAELPDESMTVLVHVPGASEPVWFGFFCDDVWYWGDSASRISDAVRHWAELPAPPEGSPG